MSARQKDLARRVEEIARERGFQPLDEVINTGKKLIPGMKIYSVNKKKSVILAVIGTEGFEAGFSIIGAHMDAPRIDLKQNPAYEDTEMVFMKTHYYGGIKNISG